VIVSMGGQNLCEGIVGRCLHLTIVELCLAPFCKNGEFILQDLLSKNLVKFFFLANVEEGLRSHSVPNGRFIAASVVEKFLFHFSVFLSSKKFQKNGKPSIFRFSFSLKFWSEYVIF
jgi:hypothetical protein